MQPRPEPRLILLCGLPGSGKTTPARRLAELRCLAVGTVPTSPKLLEEYAQLFQPPNDAEFHLFDDPPPGRGG